MRRLCVAVVAVAMMGLLVQSASAHSAFKKALQEKYDFKSVSCNSCHIKGKKKTERNDFGKAFKDLQKLDYDGMGLTEKFEAVKAGGNDAEQDAFEEEMKKAFLKVLEDVEKKESPDGKTWGELLKTADIDGIKPKE